MNPDVKDEVVQLYLDDIIPNRFQPREVFDEKALKELAVSIKEHGVIQPIIVRSVNGKYEIIAGERRYKASALAGLTKIPAIIRNLDDKESSKVALLENLQRKNLNPIEEARTYQKILELDQMTQEELAKTMGKSQSAVANKIRLLSLPEEIQDALLKEQISERHARTLLNIPDNKKQKEMLKRIIEEKLSVRFLEEEIKKMYPKDEPEVSIEETKEKEVIATPQSFVNENPLTPAQIEDKDDSDYGKVTIVPPDEGDDSDDGNQNQNRFINFGEIEKEEEELLPKEEPQETINVDIDELKNNTIDISKSTDSADLDSMLNINNTTSNQAYITPAEKIVKSETQEEKNEKSEDYFQTPDLSSLDIPIISPLNNNQSLENTNRKYTQEEAKDIINKTITDLKNHGINVNVDEMDFEKSYQIIIKINKNEE